MSSLTFANSFAVARISNARSPSNFSNASSRSKFVLNFMNTCVAFVIPASLHSFRSFETFAFGVSVSVFVLRVGCFSDFFRFLFNNTFAWSSSSSSSEYSSSSESSSESSSSSSSSVPLSITPSSSFPMVSFTVGSSNCRLLRRKSVSRSLRKDFSPSSFFFSMMNFARDWMARLTRSVSNLSVLLFSLMSIRVVYDPLFHFLFCKSVSFLREKC